MRQRPTKAVPAAEMVRIGVSRRSAVASMLGGLGAAAAVAAFPRAGLAFSIETADMPTTAAFHEACGPNAYHARLAEEVRSLLADRGPGASTAPALITCPVCGCKLPLGGNAGTR